MNIDLDKLSDITSMRHSINDDLGEYMDQSEYYRNERIKAEIKKLSDSKIKVLGTSRLTLRTQDTLWDTIHSYQKSHRK